ncbi:hypothetical protein GCM10023187_30680 [Nibrella viscosa]|uniref:Uncharacterized protein n=1 Tax=Nibrella viscosa TaxID=1084524 RepID=A0ABP8KJK4_9BACT
MAFLQTLAAQAAFVLFTNVLALGIGELNTRALAFVDTLRLAGKGFAATGASFCMAGRYSHSPGFSALAFISSGYFWLALSISAFTLGLK